MSDNLLLPGRDENRLANLEKKLQLVRGLVMAVAKGFKTGLFLDGSGGVGKSFTVLRHLEQLEAPHQLYNARLTAKGLFLALGRAPDAVHMLEDMKQRLTKDADAQGVLRSVLWAMLGHDRVVAWTTATDITQRYVFRSGLILIGNRPLACLPELWALATWIVMHCLDAGEAEPTAFPAPMQTATLQAVERNDLPAARAIHSTVPTELSDLIERLHYKRPASVAEVAKELGQLAACPERLTSDEWHGRCISAFAAPPSRSAAPTRPLGRLATPRVVRAVSSCRAGPFTALYSGAAERGVSRVPGRCRSERQRATSLVEDWARPGRSPPLSSERGNAAVLCSTGPVHKLGVRE